MNTHNATEDDVTRALGGTVPEPLHTVITVDLGRGERLRILVVTHPSGAQDISISDHGGWLPVELDSHATVTSEGGWR